MKKRQEKTQKQQGLNELDEKILFLSRPYAVVAALCWILSLFCIILLWDDKQSGSFLLSVTTIVVDTILLLVIIIRAKMVRGNTKKRDDNRSV